MMNTKTSAGSTCLFHRFVAALLSLALLAAVAVLIAGVVIINIEGARHGWLYTMQIG